MIKEKLKELTATLEEHIGQINGRVFVDSAPVLDRAWAKKSGLGWIGKNGNLINKSAGSFFFIAEIICDLDLEVDGEVEEFCGTCTRCIDACPTEAIIQPYIVDGSKCISYFTIELKDEIPVSMRGKFQDWVFGCDICQDVCPWNRFSKPLKEKKLAANKNVLAMDTNEWHELTEAVFGKLFKNSAVQRTGLDGIKRNLQFIKNEIS